MSRSFFKNTTSKEKVAGLLKNMERTLRTEEIQELKGTKGCLKNTEGYVLHIGIQKHQKFSS